MSPSAAVPVVEYVLYAPEPGTTVVPKASQKPPNVKKIVDGNVFPVRRLARYL